MATGGACGRMRGNHFLNSSFSVCGTVPLAAHIPLPFIFSTGNFEVVARVGKSFFLE